MTPSSELPAAWTKITGALQTIMSPEVYGLWFPKFSLLEDSGKTLTLVCDDPMAALWVENSYTPELKQAAMLALGGERNVKFVCADEVASEQETDAQESSANVVYVTGEQFANEFIDASRTQNGQSFAKLRRKYRKADVLLVDDVQFISGKEKTVEEFLHTFDALFHAHKTIVLCADAAACDISNLDVRLAARLESGLTVELTLPGDEDRLEILRSKRDRAGMNVSDEILEFLASRIQKSVRRLEGALLRVATFTSLSGDMPDISKIEQLLRDILREETSRVLSVETIQKRVADFYELKVSDLTGKRRPNSIAFPRQIAMYLSRRLTECSLKDIGNAFGGRDHGTVIHANKLVASRMENDVRVRDIVLRLEEDLQG